MQTIEINDCSPQLNAALGLLAVGEEAVLMVAQHPIARLIKLDSSVPEVGQGEQLAAIMEALAQLNAFSEINDPVAWQREIRQDRALPDRG